LIETSHR